MLKKIRETKAFRNIFWAVWGALALGWLTFLNGDVVADLSGLDKGLLFGLIMTSLLVMCAGPLKASNAASMADETSRSGT